MKKLIYICIVAIVALLFNSCDEDMGALVNSKTPTVNERYKQYMKYNLEHGYTTIQVHDDEYTVYVCTDTHVATENTKLQTFIQTYRKDKTCPVAVCLGDLIEANHSYYWFKEAFNHVKTLPSKPDTMFVTIGNHDVFFNQWEHYLEYWPTAMYYFVVETNGKNKAKDLYICLDNAQGSLGELQLGWLRYVLSGHDKYRHIIVYAHVNIFRRDNTSADIATVSLEETYELMSLFSQNGVEQFWSGHDHAREEFTHGNVKYIIVDSMEEENYNSSYMILHVGDKLNNTFHHIETDPALLDE